MDLLDLEPETRSFLDERLDRLLVQLRGMDEPSFRLAKFIGAIRILGPRHGVWFLFNLYRHAAWGNYQYKEFFHCFLHLSEISERLGNTFMSAMYQTARSCSNTLVARLLVSPMNRKTYEEPLHPELQSVTLGERRQWAKEFHPRRLEILMKDNDPIVMRNLLNNPKIREPHVLRIASQRPCDPAVLAEIAIHPRWSIRPIIRQAVVLNPWTGFDVSLPLLPLFNASEIQRLKIEPSLPDSLRTAIHEIQLLKEGATASDAPDFPPEADGEDSESNPANSPTGDRGSENRTA